MSLVARSRGRGKTSPSVNLISLECPAVYVTRVHTRTGESIDERLNRVAQRHAARLRKKRKKDTGSLDRVVLCPRATYYDACTRLPVSAEPFFLGPEKVGKRETRQREVSVSKRNSTFLEAKGETTARWGRGGGINRNQRALNEEEERKGTLVGIIATSEARSNSWKKNASTVACITILHGTRRWTSIVAPSNINNWPCPSPGFRPSLGSPDIFMDRGTVCPPAYLTYLLPLCLPTYLPACLPIYLPACLPACHEFLLP